MPPRISIDEEQAILRGIKAEAENTNRLRVTALKTTSERLSVLYRQYPMLQPGVLLALAKNNTPDAVVKQIAKQTALAADADPDVMNGKPKGNWLSNTVRKVGGAVAPDFVGDILNPAAKAIDTVASPVFRAAGWIANETGTTSTLKNVARPTFAAMDAAQELTQNVASMPKTFFEKSFNLASDVSNQQGSKVGFNPEIEGTGGDGSFFGSTTMAVLIDNWDKQGTGYFVSPEIKKEQALRAGAYRGFTDGGHVWTIGRGLAGAGMTEGSLGYNLLSGLVDGFVAVKVPVAPGLGKLGNMFSELALADDAGALVSAAGRVADTLQGRGAIIPLSKMTGEELKEARLLAGIVGDTVDASQANKFLGTRGGRRLVTRLAEANTAEDVRSLVGRNVYADTVKRIRDAKTELEVQEVLADILGVSQQGLARTVGVDGVHKFVLSNARRTKFIESIESVPGGKKVLRGFSPRAGNIGDMSSAAPTDVRRTINAIDDWARTALLPENEWELVRKNAKGVEEVVKMPGRRQILDQALDSMVGDSATPTARLAFKEKWQEVMQEVMVEQNGVDRNIVKAVLDNFYKGMKKRTSWAVGHDGMPDDTGFYHLTMVGGEKVTDGAFGGPMLQSELANVVIDMPNPDQIKALTGNLNWITRNKSSKALKDIEAGGSFDDNILALQKAGKLRVPFAALVWAQDKVFRRLILATGGYGVRNLVEAQMRIALTNKDVSGVLRHPFDWIAWSTHKKGGYDIKGDVFSFKTLGENMKIYREALQADLYRNFGDPSLVFRRGKRIGIYDEVDRNISDVADIVMAHGDQLGFMNTDLVSRLHASGMTEDNIVLFIRNNPEGKRWFLDEQDYHIKGRPVFDKAAGKYTGATQNVDLSDEENLRLLIREIGNRVDLHTGGDRRLLNVIAGGHLPDETIADARNIGLSKNDVGQTVSIPSAGKSKIQRQVKVVSFDENTGEAVVQPFAFLNGENTRDLRKLLEEDSVLYNDKLVKTIPLEIRAEANALQKWDEEYDSITDWVFGWLYGKPSTYLDRSPLFRQFYYQTAIDKLLTSMSDADVQLLHANILKSARKSKTSPAKFLGDKKRWQRIEDAKNGELTLKGNLTLDEVDAYAKGDALDELKNLLYDTSGSSNYLNSARVVVPFAGAFVEFYKSIGKIYTVPTASGMRLPNVAALRKTQLVVESGREADPDNDGRGYFYVDPNTNEWSFLYPFSGLTSKIFTGIDAPMSAPIGGALQGVDLGEDSFFGLKFNPGMGPYATYAYSKIMPNDPSYIEIQKLFAPFGEVDSLGGLAKMFLPSWAKKAVTVLSDDERSNTIKANAVFETALALASSGEYDLNDPDERLRLQDDAKSKATWLALFRVAGQWLGPSRPKQDFKAKLEDGDVFISQVVADLHRWQLEDYDTSAQKLFDVYGEKFWPYLARKTKTEYEGLEATTDFAKWGYDNKSLLETYPEFAAYFAPVGTDWEWQVYARQQNEGMRTKNKSMVALLEAQWSAGYSQYKLAANIIGDNPSPDEEKDLKNLKENLIKQYPGFGEKGFDVTKLKRQIEGLKKVSESDTIGDNPVAAACREYFYLRDVALKAIAPSEQGLTAKRNRNTLNALKKQVPAIIEKYPEFKRVFDRILSKELEF